MTFPATPPATRIALSAWFEQMWLVAYADGVLSEHERHTLWRVADLLHVPQGAYVHARMRAQQQAQGLSSGMPDAPAAPA